MALSSFLSCAPQFIGNRYQSHLYEKKLSNQENNPSIAGNKSNKFLESSHNYFNFNFPFSDKNPMTYVIVANFNRVRYFPKHSKDKNYLNLSFQNASLKNPVHIYNDYSTFKINNFTNISEKTGYSIKDSSLYILVLLGNILKGVGHTPVHSLGMSFIDDFSSRRNLPLYIGKSFT